MADKPVRIGVVGLGYWGPNLLRNFSSAAGASVQMCCDLDDARCRKFAKSYPAVQFTRSLEEMLKSPDVDAVAVATPVHTHYEIARAALGAGKHVLVEKPLTMRTDHAEELVALADKNGSSSRSITFTSTAPRSRRSRSSWTAASSETLLHRQRAHQPRALPA
jgi:predicted dehydrogenase